MSIRLFSVGLVLLIDVIFRFTVTLPACERTKLQASFRDHKTVYSQHGVLVEVANDSGGFVVAHHDTLVN